MKYIITPEVKFLDAWQNRYLMLEEFHRVMGKLPKGNPEMDINMTKLPVGAEVTTQRIKG